MPSSRSGTGTSSMSDSSGASEAFSWVQWLCDSYPVFCEVDDTFIGAVLSRGAPPLRARVPPASLNNVSSSPLHWQCLSPCVCRHCLLACLH